MKTAFTPLCPRRAVPFYNLQYSTCTSNNGRDSRGGWGLGNTAGGRCDAALVRTNFIDHRIDINNVIKVADFGLSEDMYAKNYYRQSDTEECKVKLPIRWMAPESFHDGIFSEKTDVVSLLHAFLSRNNRNKIKIFRGSGDLYVISYINCYGNHHKWQLITISHDYYHMGCVRAARLSLPSFTPSTLSHLFKGYHKPNRMWGLNNSKEPQEDIIQPL